MLEKEDLYGTEGVEQSPEQKARIEDAWITAMLKDIETGKLEVLTNESEGKIIVYEPDKEEESKNGGEIDPARVIWMTDIENFKKVRTGKINDAFVISPKKETNH